MMFEETGRISKDPIEVWDENTGEAEAMDPGAPINDTSPQKIFLPRGSAETRFAPRQYYYLASKSGVVPSWAVHAD
jgi:hypothetical protein